MMARVIQRCDAIVVHCSDTSGGDVQSIRHFHTQPPPNGRGWDDIGYHYVIRTDGEAEVGRPLELTGAHVEGANTRTIGICLIGKSTFSERQFATLRKLIVTLRCIVGAEIPVRGHREYESARKQGKTCPKFDVSTLGL